MNVNNRLNQLSPWLTPSLRPFIGTNCNVIDLCRMARVNRLWKMWVETVKKDRNTQGLSPDYQLCKMLVDSPPRVISTPVGQLDECLLRTGLVGLNHETQMPYFETSLKFQHCHLLLSYGQRRERLFPTVGDSLQVGQCLSVSDNYLACRSSVCERGAVRQSLLLVDRQTFKIIHHFNPIRAIIQAGTKFSSSQEQHRKDRKRPLGVLHNCFLLPGNQLLTDVGMNCLRTRIISLWEITAKEMVHSYNHSINSEIYNFDEGYEKWRPTHRVRN